MLLGARAEGTGEGWAGVLRLQPPGVSSLANIPGIRPCSEQFQGGARCPAESSLDPSIVGGTEGAAGTYSPVSPFLTVISNGDCDRHEATHVTSLVFLSPYNSRRYGLQIRRVRLREVK